MAGLAHPYVAGVERVEAELDELAGLDPGFLSLADKRQALLSMVRVSSRAQALESRVIACAEDVADAEGFRDAAAWVAQRAHASSSSVRRAQRLGLACEQRWHRVGEALGEGRMSIDQGHVVVAALDEVCSAGRLVEATAAEWGDVLVRAEAYLVEQAVDFGPRALQRLGERLLEVVAPEWVDELAERRLRDAERAARRRTTLKVQGLGDGTALIKARVPESVALRLTTLLESFTNPRREDGESAELGADGRRVPYERRLGEAFCSLLESLDPSRLPLHGGDATTVVITMDLTALVEGLGSATLADGSRITAGEARRLACTANLVPAVLGTRSIPLDLGHSTRLFSPGQRKALAIRDRECRASGCSIPATWCEAHHLRPWSEGGKTDLENGLLLCSHHHHLVHDDRYLHERMPNGDLRFARGT
ncbi:HNH endonuclease signature motif containing protein [Nocardioides ochotonae]|uniref:HNH endonuclease signature motif containing protein n=1 Tax=Nocardioides ochotonae TaxID=2685869 RepID=UPI0014074482|nr:HNH endonuclease signature motif containing protein [Nocardioides ochotonae]